MDFGGVVGMDGLVGVSPEGGGVFSSSLASADSELSRQKGLFASSFLKHGRSGGPEDHDWRSLKVGRTEAMLAAPALTKAAPCPLRSNAHPLFPDGGQMLSFSSSPANPDALMLTSDGTLPYYHHPSVSSSAPSSFRNAGLLSGSPNSNMHGVLARVRGPFTPSQWMELEHQALIYKYIAAKMPIPPNLLDPIRRSLNPSGFSPFSAGSFGSSTFGWGSFHLGFSGNTDPEPGRCRRTDGKKWRCSRDAVADQKYCERHMNRGRHRSRKHVEGQAGHAAKVVPAIAASQSPSSVSGGGSSSTLNIGPQQTKSLQPNSTDPSPAQLKKVWMSKENGSDCAQDLQSFSMLTSMNSKPTNNSLAMSKLSDPLEGTSSRAEFGHIFTESFVNPLRSFYSESIRFIPTPKLSEQHSEPQPLRQFINDWPKTQSDRSTVTWPNVEETQSDRTQLSISIPMASSDFSSSSSSPNHENLALSPLKLSRDFGPIHMGLGVGGVLNEASQRQVNCIPISWEASMGGPLGEVLTSTSSTPVDQTNNCSSSSLNLLTDGWDLSPRLEASPTGVLQKTSFGSLTSSTGSSPRAENHKGHDSIGSMDDDFLGSTLVNPPTFASL